MHARAGSGEREYLAVESARQTALLVRSEIRRLVRRRGERDPSVVRSNYDAMRQNRPVLDFDRHFFGDPIDERHVLLDDRVAWGNVSHVKRHILTRIAGAVKSYTTDLDAPTVIEFGCGGGRNLLYLKEQMPELRCFGVDISPASIDLARRAAEGFGLDVQFDVADVTATNGAIKNGDVCYSFHALEQMPRLFPAAVDTMLRSSRRAVLFFEPVGELYPASTRGCLARMRLREHDYLDGLYDYLREVDAPVVKAKRLRTSVNPLNETVEIHVDHRSEPVRVRQSLGAA